MLSLLACVGEFVLLCIIRILSYIYIQFSYVYAYKYFACTPAQMMFFFSLTPLSMSISSTDDAKATSI